MVGNEKELNNNERNDGRGLGVVREKERNMTDEHTHTRPWILELSLPSLPPATPSIPQPAPHPARPSKPHKLSSTLPAVSVRNLSSNVLPNPSPGPTQFGYGAVARWRTLIRLERVFVDAEVDVGKYG